MAELQTKPLQAMFDVDDEEAETVEGIGFEPGTKYRFSIEKAPQGKYMQYGAAKGGGFVLSKKCPDDLANQYKKHPDQFEIFTAGEINGIQALVPGKDFDKFKPFMSKIVDVAWVHTTESGQKRLVFMTLNVQEHPAVNPGHPEWESKEILISRRLGYEPPAPKSKEKFNFSWLHTGIAIEAEVVMTKQKGSDRERPAIDISTIELVSEEGAKPAQQQIAEEDIDPEIKMTVLELAEGCKNAVEVIKKVKAHLKETGEKDPKVLGNYSAAITKMKDRKEILA
jgi:hypothetical protein